MFGFGGKPLTSLQGGLEFLTHSSTLSEPFYSYASLVTRDYPRINDILQNSPVDAANTSSERADDGC
jgi:hypothetical protein